MIVATPATRTLSIHLISVISALRCFAKAYVSKVIVLIHSIYNRDAGMAKQLWSRSLQGQAPLPFPFESKNENFILI
jgi:hypothetical protein